MPLSTDELFKRLKPKRWHPVTFARAHSFRFACVYCGLKFYRSYENYLQWSEDHVIPSTAGGSNDIENRVPCCKICNSIKGDWDPRKKIGPNRTTAEYVDAVIEKFGALRERRKKEFEAHRQILLEEGAIDLG